MIVGRGNEENIFDGQGMTEISKLQIKHVVLAPSTWAHAGTQVKATKKGAV